MSSVQCSHLLQKHTKSRNPTDSFRKKPITRSPDEARENIKNFLSILKENPSQFAEYALKYSECSSAGKGGNLGHF